MPLSQWLDVNLWMMVLQVGHLVRITCSPPSPDSQVVLGGLHESRDSTAISAEFTNEWRVLCIAISHLNVI